MQAISAEALKATIKESKQKARNRRPQRTHVPRYLAKSGDNVGKWCTRETDTHNIIPAQRDGKAVYLVRHTFYVLEGPLDSLDTAEKTYPFWFIAPVTKTTTKQRREPETFETFEGWTQLDKHTMVKAEAAGGEWIPFPIRSLSDVLAAYPTANISIQ